MAFLSESFKNNIQRLAGILNENDANQQAQGQQYPRVPGSQQNPPQQQQQAQQPQQAQRQQPKPGKTVNVSKMLTVVLGPMALEIHDMNRGGAVVVQGYDVANLIKVLTEFQNSHH